MRWNYLNYHQCMFGGHSYICLWNTVAGQYVACWYFCLVLGVGVRSCLDCVWYHLVLMDYMGISGKCMYWVE